MKQWKKWMTRGLGLAALCAATNALADVRLEGDWAAAAPRVTLRLEGVPKDAALAELARKAGWNLVIHTDGIRSAGDVTLDVTDADAKEVLESMLAEGSFVAKRRGAGGTLLEISALEAGVKAPPPGTGDARKRDRAVLGEDLRIEKGEVVGDVSVTGGSAEIFGTVDGDLVVTGGSVTVHEGGVITGDTLAVGGRVHVEKGGQARGDHKVIGGIFTHDDEGGVTSEQEPKGESLSLGARTSRGVSDVFGNFAFLFVLGALFLAVVPDRMDRLRTAVAEKPVASIAYGIAGVIGSIAGVVVLCVTVIGIPFALVFLMALAVAVAGALTASLTTAGAALLQHRTKNHYVHLALGSALFAVCGVLPWLGGWLQCAVVLASFGILVTTRVAGFVNRKTPGDPATSSGLPYR